LPFSLSIIIQEVASRLSIRVFYGLCVRLPPIFAHRIAAHLDAMVVLDQPVEDAIGQRGIADVALT